MNNKKTTIHICCLLVLLSCICESASAVTIMVPGDYATIQDAVNNAATGDTVLVSPGVYRENITMADGIDVVSKFGPHMTVIDGNNTGITFLADNVSTGSLRGFSIENGAGWNVRTQSCGAGLTVRDNIIINSLACCVDLSASSIYLHNNLIMNAGNHGIHSLDGDTSVLSNNTITGSRNAAIEVTISSPVIRDNILVNSPYGIRCSSSSPDLDYNTFWNHSVSPCSGCVPGPRDMLADPLFTTGTYGDYYLSQINAGQLFNSPCFDSGSATAIVKDLAAFTTRTDNMGDEAQVDRGYHYYIPVDAVPVTDCTFTIFLVLLFTTAAIIGSGLRS